MATTDRLKITKGVRIVNGRAYGPGTHTINDPDVARQLRAKGAIRVKGEGAGATEVTTSAVESVDDLTGPIHDKFPYHTKLAENGVTSFEQLVAKTRDELIQMEGIGEVSADRILQGLKDEFEDRKAASQQE